jgi:hypothetical protein
MFLGGQCVNLEQGTPAAFGSTSAAMPLERALSAAQFNAYATSSFWLGGTHMCRRCAVLKPPSCVYMLFLFLKAVAHDGSVTSVTEAAIRFLSNIPWLRSQHQAPYTHLPTYRFCCATLLWVLC